MTCQKIYLIETAASSPHKPCSPIMFKTGFQSSPIFIGTSDETIFNSNYSNCSNYCICSNRILPMEYYFRSRNRHDLQIHNTSSGVPHRMPGYALHTSQSYQSHPILLSADPQKQLLDPTKCLIVRPEDVPALNPRPVSYS